MLKGRKIEWKSHLGNTVTIEGSSDEHLANTIQYISQYYYCYSSKILKEFKKEARRRKLTKEFLDKAQYPYKDGRGNYIVWDFAKAKPKVIGSYLRSKC